MTDLSGISTDDLLDSLLEYPDCEFCHQPTMCSWETGYGLGMPDVVCHECSIEMACDACGFPAEDYSEVSRIHDSVLGNESETATEKTQ